ncbi:MAG: HAMP domain-containing protein, partial [Solirubrobacteraceae bacterium]
MTIQARGAESNVRSTGRKGLPAAAAVAEPGSDEPRDRRDLTELLEALRAARDGDFSVRLSPNGDPQLTEVARAFNELLDRNDRMSLEIARVGKIIG